MRFWYSIIILLLALIKSNLNNVIVINSYKAFKKSKRVTSECIKKAEDKKKDRKQKGRRRK